MVSMKNSHIFWDKAAPYYDQQSLMKYGKMYRETIDLGRRYLKPRYSVLDFGCGTGIVTMELAPCVKKITAIDGSPAMIDVARGKAEARAAGNIEFLVTDIFDGRFDHKKFDAVLAFNVLHYLPDPAAALRRIRELLAPSGVFLSTTDCRGSMNPVLRTLALFLSGVGLIPRMAHYTPHTLEAAFAANGFRVLEARSLYPAPPNYFIAAV
jgi:ubiquinone/menaquinone biosynthesis C-methylase UbiE